MDVQIVGGRYEILEPLGHGGMATVYKGRDLQTGETIAIKRLKREVLELDPGLAERFTREAEALRRLNHPNIVKAMGMVEENGQHFAIIEYVPGGDLRELLAREEKLSPQRVMEMALDLADALARAHRLKIIHRDIKPGNVLIAQDGTPRLTDFGIARFTDSASQTQTGQLMGTLAYLSPEGCVGEALDHRTDIWSMGVMLYEMLAGFRPFDAPDGNQAALLLSILSQPAPLLSDYAPQTPPAFVQLIGQMLEKDRDARIQSVRQVGAQIEAILAGRNVSDVVDSNTTGNLPPVEEQEKTPTQKILSQAKSEPRLSRTLQPTPTPVFTMLEAEEKEVAPPVQKSRRLNPLVLIGGGLLLIALVAGVLVLPNLNRAADTSAVTVQAVDEGKYMVLVAPLEMLDGAEDNVTRFIYDDLQRKFEREALFSPYQVRLHPKVITSEAEAESAAEDHGAAVVLWGDYDGTTARVNTELGSLAIYDDITINRDQLTPLSDVRYILTNARQESLASAVLAIMNIVATANNSIYDIALNLAVLDLLNPQTPEVEGIGVGVRWHRYFSHFLGPTEAALTEIEEAIKIDGGNPILYAAYGFSLARTGRLEEAEREMRSGGRLLPSTSVIDDMGIGILKLLVKNDPAAAIPHFDQTLQIQPDDWMAFYARGASYFLLKDYTRAKADLEQALVLNPDFPPAYPFLTAIAMREGDLVNSQEYFQILQTRFPDPSFTERLLVATYDVDADESSLVAGVTAFTSFALAQWDDVIRNTEVALVNLPLTDLYLLRGVAFCNLENYQEAEATYTKLLEIEPDYKLGILLRGEVRLKMGNLLGAGSDFANVLSSDQSGAYTPFIPAYRAGEISCENFFDVDLKSYLETPTP
jgi:serine/threonine protein kinase/tetratricopeptide (TPR) repeat protein